MPAYRISLFKRLTSSDGHPFKCLQHSVEIRSARTAERAIEAVRRRYQRGGRGPDWGAVADLIEAEQIDIAPDLMRRHYQHQQHY